MVYRYYLKINGEKKYCQNFKLKEFVCKDEFNKILSDSFFFVITKLQSIIGNFNNPIHLNSAYKIVSYNENNW